jgi:hypothetical protein
MSECEKCRYYAAELHREMKRTTVLSNALQSIYGIAKDNMWYPSDIGERGEDGFKSSEAFIIADTATVKREGYDK